MGLLEDGTFEELPGRAYRLIRKENDGKSVVVFGPIFFELGHEMLVSRPTVVPAIAKAKEEGNHVVVSGFRNRHPFYAYADEFWGLTVSRSGDINWVSWYDFAKKEKLGDHNDALDMGFLGKDWTSPSSGYEKWYSPLPKPSPAASNKAKGIVGDNPFVTICPRYLGKPPRDFEAWQDYVDQIRGTGVRVISTTPMNKSAIISGIEHLQDLVGLDDLLDVELALHSMASCCVTTNTGAAGIMIYANAKTLLILGGTDGFEPGWQGLNELVSKENGVPKTELIPVPGEYLFVEKEIHRKLASEMARMTLEVLSRQTRKFAE